jgi:predicted O-linked N-acetylglucosamine transferase (SPINDLY family)
LKQYDEALASYDRALALAPDSVEALNNRGNVLREIGDSHAAVESYRRAVALSPDDPRLHDALIFSLLRTFTDPNEVRAQCSVFAERFEQHATRLQHRNTAMPDRRLKLGYVSADFRDHPVAYHIEPVLANHDRAAVEVFCYFNHRGSDLVTERLERFADHWRPVAALSDNELASMVQRDGIDILVDLSGHTIGNRLLAFACKPAPVQITWLGLPATTGLSSIDYRLTDGDVDPPGVTERYHTESLVRLTSHACFRASIALPPVNDLPALARGYVTFGSFNEIGKISPGTSALWARLLLEVPNSRLLLACDAYAARYVQDRFTALGIGPERLVVVDRLPLSDYLKLHNEVDIALDSFPFNGGTVTRHALWMGVPVITLPGAMPASRVGVALMSQLGLESFVAATGDEYVEIAKRWTADLGGLAEVRRTLRSRMEEAPFSNGPAYTRELEAAYRSMWRMWCAQRVAG